ncbi:VWA domain-containing protein [Endothiovibrio diazotrophicus]
MEEQVGELWHRLVTRLAEGPNIRAAVRLAEVERTVGVLFRALGGDGGLRVEAAEATGNRARRRWLARIAGSGERVALAWRDEQALRLPPVVAWFAERALNRDLYLWLAALAAADDGAAGDWFSRNRALTRLALGRFPGMAARYRRLVAAHLEQRLAPERLPADEAAAERAVRLALVDPASGGTLPAARRPPQPVPLWFHPDPPRSAAGTDSAEGDGEAGDSGRGKEVEEMGRRRAERVDEPEPDRGLVTVRMENILTLGDYVGVDRGSEEEEELEQAEQAARDMERIAVSRDRRTRGARLKFDLDLPAEAEDDRVLGEGILLPEWDWKRRRLVADHCRIVPLVAAQAEPCELPARLRRTARRLRSQFQALAPARVWHRAQPDGQEIDLDAWLRHTADREAGHGSAAAPLYRELRQGARDLACLLMADLSLSTDSWIDDHHRVIEVIRDSLLLFAESLAATGDRFALHGFSSRRRDPVRVHTLKGFDEPYGGTIRGRIEALRPGYYTRLGAAIRYATRLLEAQAAGRRLLLILTDGKPNDLDRYEGRYGIEDTRQAIHAARRRGLQPFCVTIDRKGSEYLPHLFGSGGFVVIRRPQELPGRLPLLYARLTAGSV